MLSCLLQPIDAFRPITMLNLFPHLLIPLLAPALTPHSANSLSHYEHINFQSNDNHVPLTVHVHTQTCSLWYQYTQHTCSWYSMPIDNVLMRMAIMIPLLKYLLPTIRSSLVCSPAQQRL